MTDSDGEFSAKMGKLFRLPACPPIGFEQTDNAGTLRSVFHGGWIGHATGTIDAPWPSAVFAAVRWSNLYFSSDRFGGGDMVGGPVAAIFGRGVVDHPLNWRELGCGYPHNMYWSWPDQVSGDAWSPASDVRAYSRPPAHIAVLRQAINLFERPELELQLLKATPVGRSR
jgi:hypothetical protein